MWLRTCLQCRWHASEPAIINQMRFVYRPLRTAVLLLIVIFVSLCIIESHRSGLPENLERVWYKPWKVTPWSKPQDGDSNIPASPKKSGMCQKYPHKGNIAIVVKTGATEAAERLPPLLNTLLPCVQDVMVFSDLEQEMYSVKIYDVLSRFSDDHKEHHPEFELYRQQKALKDSGQEDKIAELSRMPAPAREGFGHDKSAAWALDKYKFVPEVEMAWELQPGKDWYLFMEGDTYLSWPNLLRWLGTLDPTQKLYIGNAIQKSDDREPLYFAQGGNGFILSGPAVREFALDHGSITAKLESRMQDWWAGDFMLADALYDEMGLKVSNVFPMFTEHDTAATPFGLDRWCQPAITLHHMDEAQMHRLASKEVELSHEKLLLRDIYDIVYGIEPLPKMRENWDNMASDKKYRLEIELPPGTDPNKDFASCKAACEENYDCLQFNFLNTTISKSPPDTGFEELNSCYLSVAFRLGHAKDTQDFENDREIGTSRSWTSGWRADKITEWVRSRTECPAGDHWIQLH